MSPLQLLSAIRVSVYGARGKSFGDIARQVGSFGAVKTDTDSQVMGKFADYAITKNPGFQSTIPGPADNTYTTLASFKASDIARKTASLVGAPGLSDGRFNWTIGNFTGQADDANIIKADSTALSVGAWLRQTAAGLSYKQAGAGTRVIDAQAKSRDLVSKSDFAGIVGNGVVDDTAALTAAIVQAGALGRALHLPGRYAVSNLRLTGLGDYLTITGEPTFVQFTPNTPCIIIEGTQQSVGYDFSCTVVPHVSSEKSKPANMGVNLTGFSGARITVRLGQVNGYTATTGRFNTMVYADAGLPFHYANHIHVIANSVPAPARVLRYGNRGIGAQANPNINRVSGWCVNLDTVAGDILLDLGDTTQAIVSGPTLLEGCPNATGIKAGNLTTIRDVWFELIGSAVDFTGTSSTTPNNGRVERCYFSGGGHTILINNMLGAPPTFEECVGDGQVTYLDQAGSSLPHGLFTRSYQQPVSPTIAFTMGGGALSPQQNNLRHRVDHHGRTTFHLSYTTPGVVGRALLRISPPAGYEIEQANVGIRNSSNEQLAVGIDDDLAGRDFGWTFANTTQHTLNVRVTLRATS